MMKMEMETRWVKLVNALAQDELRKFVLDRDRFTFKGIHRGQAVFQWVLISREYDVALLSDLSKYVEVFRRSVNQLAEVTTAKICIKRHPTDQYYSAQSYLVWYYYIHFDQSAEKGNSALLPVAADLQQFWRKACTYSNLDSGQVRICGYQEHLGVVELTVSSSLKEIRYRGGIKKYAQDKHGPLLHCLKGYATINFIEFFIKVHSESTEYYFAGPVGDELFLINEYELD